MDINEEVVGVELEAAQTVESVSKKSKPKEVQVLSFSQA